MADKAISGECLNCESSFFISYPEELVSSEYPEHCPFCGEQIEDINEEYEESYDEDLDEDEEW